MPIQEMLTGVTFPSPVTNINTIPTPLQYLGSLLQLWIEGNVGVTADGSGGTNAWADQSSYGRNLVVSAQSPGDPTITASAQNGLAGVTAAQDGTTMTSTFLRSAYSSALDFLATTPFSVVLAYKPQNPPPGTSYGGDIGNFAYNQASGQGWVVGTNALKPSLRLINTKATAECSVSTASALIAGIAYIVQIVNTGTGTAAGIQIYVNNVLQTTTTLFDNLAGAVTQNSTNGVAAPSCGTGGAYGPGRSTILEACVISKALTAHDVAIIDAYLNAKWAIHS